MTMRANAGPDPRAAVEERTRLWLEASYLQAMARLGESPEPVWDAHGQPQRLTRYHFQEIQRKLKIFRWLDRLQFESFIDIGSGFDIYPKLVHERYGVPAYFSDFSHSMNLPYGGRASGKLDRAVTLNSARLPFDDDAFDVVLASEVLEHLVRPVETIAELLRVSRKYLIMTSLEALSADWWKRFRSHFHVDVRREHVERNFLLLHEFEALFGPDWRHENLLFDPALPASGFAAEETQQAAYASLRDVESLVTALCRAVAVDDHRPGAMGILLVKVQHGAGVAPRQAEAEPVLARWLIERTAEFERFVLGLAKDIRRGTAEMPARDRPIDAALLALLRCPDCRGHLERVGANLRCPACSRVFPGEYGVPILYPNHLPDGSDAAAECLQRICGGDAARRRIVCRLMRRLRRNECPPGPLRRLIWGIERALEGRRA